jgi:predicted tellurium resistance membrane protein TerC
MDWLLSSGIALVALTAMEIVLGIDNIVFIAIITSRLPIEQQPLARRLGLLFALGTRIALLATLSWVIHLTEPIFHLTSLGLWGEWLADEHVNGVSVKDLILLVGGLFLIYKSVVEIHHRVEGEDEQGSKKGAKVSFLGIILQIAVLDIIFSLDSVITAVGMANELSIMIAAVVLAVVVMLIFAEQVSAFVSANPTVKMLALSFLILIGVMLVAESVEAGIDKGYIYFAMAFALGVELLNLRVRLVEDRKQPKTQIPPSA